ncbi:MAG: ATP:cob(I)alamin adenosyltransferase [Rickettsiales bacterium]|jgi:ATP:cob(I)alamin adenosyltransferase|nr:ATP:cob(I)alamin adenosyltransferase [Rickettsiales bacterium]
MAIITTKTGDSGTTALLNMIVSKAHPVIDIMGDIDEMACILGMEGEQFDALQTFLSDIMGYMYYRSADSLRLIRQVEALEDYIATHNNSIPPKFINPRGAISVARSVCRRCERKIVAFMELEREKPESARYMDMDAIQKYFNRLSDYLFVKGFERTAAQPELFVDEMSAATPIANVA